MFKDTTVYNFETLEKRLREESFLNAGVKITLTDERELYTPVLEDGKEGEPCYRTEVMCYEGGIKSFVTYLGEKRDLEVLHPNVIYLKGQTERGMAEIALQYNSSYNELVLSFANNVNTPDGGTHEEGFRSSLTRVFNDYGRSHGLLKDKDENLSGATSVRASSASSPSSCRRRSLRARPRQSWAIPRSAPSCPTWSTQS